MMNKETKKYETELMTLDMSILDEVTGGKSGKRRRHRRKRTTYIPYSDDDDTNTEDYYN